MIVIQYASEEIHSYLVVSLNEKAAAVINPVYDIKPYLTDSERLGVKIKHILMAEGASAGILGHLELQRETGAILYCDNYEGAPVSSKPLLHEMQICFGEVILEIDAQRSDPENPLTIRMIDINHSSDIPLAIVTPRHFIVGDASRTALKKLGFS